MIMVRRFAVLSGVLAALWGCSAQAVEEQVRLDAQFVDIEGAPLRQFPVRIVVGDIPQARTPSAGKVLTTDEEGRIRLEIAAPVKTRHITLDNMFARHKSQFLEIGVELELRGQPALYWIELDHLRAGTAGLMKAFVADSKGRFDQMLRFHPDNHSWSIPGDPEGLLMSGIGADLKYHDMEGAPGEGWTVKLTIEKHEFTMR
jgi:hypothetical protein